MTAARRDMARLMRYGADWPGLATSRFVEHGGVAWHVQQSGQGRDVLLVHGAGASTHTWRDIIPPLSKRACVTAVDLPGHGLTEASAGFRPGLREIAASLTALAEAIGLDAPIGVGHSAGAAILVQAGRAKSRAAPRGIVAINGAFEPFGGASGSLFPLMARVLFANPFAAQAFAWRGRDRAAVRRVIASTGSNLDDVGVELYARLFSDARHVEGVLRMMACWDLSPLVKPDATPSAPMTLIVGEDDRAVPPSVAERFAARVSDARVVRLSGLGHLAHEEAPEKVVSIVLEGLATEPASSGGPSVGSET